MDPRFSYPSPQTYDHTYSHGSGVPSWNAEQHSLVDQPSPYAKQEPSVSISEGQRRASKTTKVKNTWSHHRMNIFSVALASVSFAATAWFARATFSANMLADVRKTAHLSLSNTLGVLRTLQEVTSVLTGLVLNNTFEVIEWSLASGDRGIGALSLLSLSPTTRLLGVVGVAFSRRGRVADRLWALLR